MKPPIRSSRILLALMGLSAFISASTEAHFLSWCWNSANKKGAMRIYKPIDPKVKDLIVGLTLKFPQYASFFTAFQNDFAEWFAFTGFQHEDALNLGNFRILDVRAASGQKMLFLNFYGSQVYAFIDGGPDGARSWSSVTGLNTLIYGNVFDAEDGTRFRITGDDEYGEVVSSFKLSATGKSDERVSAFLDLHLSPLEGGKKFLDDERATLIQWFNEWGWVYHTDLERGSLSVLEAICEKTEQPVTVLRIDGNRFSEGHFSKERYFFFYRTMKKSRQVSEYASDQELNFNKLGHRFKVSDGSQLIVVNGDKWGNDVHVLAPETGAP
jgi:hypothetical protein